MTKKPPPHFPPTEATLPLLPVISLLTLMKPATGLSFEAMLRAPLFPFTPLSGSDPCFDRFPSASSSFAAAGASAGAEREDGATLSWEQSEETTAEHSWVEERVRLHWEGAREREGEGGAKERMGGRE